MIEYTITYTGIPTKDHEVELVRMEITNVEDTNNTVTVTSRFSDGSIETTNYTLNLLTGNLIDDFIIPANLNAGDKFKDENFSDIVISEA